MQVEPKADVNMVGAGLLTDERKLSLQTHAMGVDEEV
jgi:hypothetical protein